MQTEAKGNTDEREIQNNCQNVIAEQPKLKTYGQDNDNTTPVDNLE